MNWGGEKGETLRQAMNVALQPGTHGGAHPRERRSQIVSGILFGQNEQRDSVGILEGVAELRDLGKDMAQSSSLRCQLVGISDRETEPQSLAAP